MANMNEATLIYPHQLFKEHPALKKDRPVYFVEDELFFTQYKFHKQKLLFHRASINAYAQTLRHKGFDVQIVQDSPPVKYVHLCEPSDDWLLEKLKKKYELKLYPSPNFISPIKDLLKRLGQKTHYSMQSFYIQERKRLSVLVENNKPIGGQWSLDTENRKKLPKELLPPALPKLKAIDPALKKSIEQDFKNHYGHLEHFNWPCTHDEAEAWLETFLKERFEQFGPYEDAITMRHPTLYHSTLSPLLNSGLLTPNHVIKRSLEYGKKHEIPLNSLEGFIRQILGWREFVRGLYHLKGREQRSRNFWGHKNSLPKAFWEGNTGLLPADHCIQELLKSGYNHHIERLMILGNLMLLCEIDPDQVYEWFMTLYIDAYDWVMVPNIYGMSQYADGGLMTTKPYISSSNYLRKMSDFPKGAWCDTWDGLYWRFIHKHQSFFSKNPRLSVMTLALKRMSQEKLKTHLHNAEAFLEKHF